MIRTEHLSPFPSDDLCFYNPILSSISYVVKVNFENLNKKA